jgi:hypothetical protein
MSASKTLASVETETMYDWLIDLLNRDLARECVTRPQLNYEFQASGVGEVKWVLFEQSLQSESGGEKQ